MLAPPPPPPTVPDLNFGVPVAPRPTGPGLWLWEESLGPLLLDCSTGYVVTEIDLGFPTVRESMWNLPLRNGTFDTTCYTGARAISLAVTVDGRVAPADTLLSRLRAYVNPCLRPELLYTPEGVNVQRSIKMRGADAPARIVRRKYVDVVTQWVSVDSGLVLSAQENCREIRPGGGDAVDGRRYDLIHDRVYPFAAGPGTAYLVRNAGDAPAPWRATIYGAIDQPVLTINGQKMQFDKNGGVTLASGSYLDVDERDRSVTLDNGESRYSRWDFTQGWPMLPPGDNYVSIEAVGSGAYGADASVRFCWWDAWF
jgi:hypothetical protein